jgi:hypothetical protein
VGSTEASLSATVFGAEQTLKVFAEQAMTLRQRCTARLLVPRLPEQLDLNDPVVRVVSLREVLEAVLSTHTEDLRSDSPDEPWPLTPHIAADGSTSLTQSVLEACALPYPGPIDQANDAPPDSPEFERFLRSQAVVLTPPAKAYVAGLAQVPPRGATVRESHEVALSATLSGRTEEELQLLVADIGPLPSGMTWLDLLDPDALDEFLAESNDLREP